MPAQRSKSQQAFVVAYRQGLGARAAARLSDDDICRDALGIAARIDLEIARLRATGGLKTVNKSYRQYRLDGTARGERVMRYADWMERYKADLIREIAANLR